MSPSRGAHQARNSRTASTPGNRMPGIARLFTAGMVMAALGCSETTAPTRTLTPEEAALAAGGNQRVKVRTLQLSVNTLRIEGPSISGDANISNSGPAIPSGASMQAVITQGAATREAASGPLTCSGSPGDVGKLPTGGCDIMFSATASNSRPGSGTLVPGPAVFVLRVMQTVGTTQTELGSKSVNVNLVASPGITALSLASTTLAIDGPGTTYTATLLNPASSLQNVLLQGWIVQGLTRRESDRRPLDCGSNMGVFPPGSCTITLPAPVSSSAPGVGTLTPGAAIFELQLIQRTGGTSTTLDIETVPITLTSSGAPTFVNLALEHTKIVIDGYSVAWTATLQNAGPPVSDLHLIGRLEQDQAGGTVVHGLSGRIIDCGAGAGVLPTTGSGTCIVEHGFVFTPDPGAGALQLGPARVVFDLYTPVGGVPFVYGQQSVDVTLIPAGIRIESIVPASNNIELNASGSTTNVVANIYNPSGARTLILIQGWVVQGTARRAAGGTNVTCGPASGTLPEGDCAQESVISAHNANLGEGTLLPGSAVFELELKHWDGMTETILDTKSIPITLVMTAPGILNISPESPSLTIDGPAMNYSATLFNPNATLSGVVIQTYIDQGTTSVPAGGILLACPGTSGELPTGTCVTTQPTHAANSSLGTLVAGFAMFRVELWQGTTRLHSMSFAIFLNGP